MNKISTEIKSFLSPNDRIFSARSLDGITWFREKGVRIEASDAHPVTNAFYCYVHQPADLHGAYEMYYHASISINNRWDTQISKAVSTDGLQWDQEPVVILKDPDKEINLEQIRAPHLVECDGFWRLYFSARDAAGIVRIYSARSEDRTNWQVESGARIGPELFTARENEDKPVTGVSDSSIMVLPDGNLRMFFSTFRGEHWRQNICSAVSKDGLNWSIEEGIRIDYGPAGYRLIANNPSIIKINNKWILYFRGSNNMPIRDKIFRAESANGLDWSVEGVALAPNPECRKEKHEVAHPFVFKTTEGFYRMYYTGCCGTILDSTSYKYYQDYYRAEGIEILYD